MITVFIIANEDAKALGRTLNALIGATVVGLVREVILIAASKNEDVAKLADYAGCAVIGVENFAAAIISAKGEWLMLFEGGALPEQGWVEAVSNYIQSAAEAVRFTRSPLAKRSMKQMLFQRETPLALGIIIHKPEALALGKSSLSTPELLAKAAKLKQLPALLRPASNAHPSAA